MNNYEVEEYVIDEDKFPKNGMLRQDTELFDDDRYIAQQVVSVKRVQFGTAEDWEINLDKKTVLIIKGIRFTAKERAFLRTVEGVQFLMAGYKAGWKSIAEFKRNIKSKV